MLIANRAPRNRKPAGAGGETPSKWVYAARGEGGCSAINYDFAGAARRRPPPTFMAAGLIPASTLQRSRRDLFGHISFDHVARLHVLKAFERDAALEPLLDFAHVVFEAAQ